MTMLHSFHLISNDEIPPTEYMHWPNASDGVTIHDDLIGYMWDSLTWIPCFYPHNGMRSSSVLDRYAPNVFVCDGAAKLADVLMAYRQLFLLGPTQLRLHLGLVFVPSNEDQEYYKATPDFASFGRDDVAETLYNIAQLASQATSDKSGKYLAHKGL